MPTSGDAFILGPILKGLKVFFFNRFWGEQIRGSNGALPGHSCSWSGPLGGFLRLEFLSKIYLEPV